jgi:hypothetical protein
MFFALQDFLKLIRHFSLKSDSAFNCAHLVSIPGMPFF